MSKHTNAKLGITFETPDKLTVREQLEFMSIIHSGDEESEKYQRQWRASLPLIRGWRCEWLPDPEKMDMGLTTDDPRYLFAVMWASVSVFNHVMGLDALPKDLSSRSSSAPSEEPTPLPSSSLPGGLPSQD